MPETRIVETVYGLGGFDPTKPNKNILEEVTAVISDAQLADEAEAKAVRDLIDGLASNNALKKIGLYLRKKGYLP